MGRMYTAQFTDVTVSAVQDLFELVAPADAIILVHALYLGQRSDVGDAAEEILSVQISSGQTTSGSGGSAVTPVPINFGDAASGVTVEANNTTQALDGTIVIHHSFAWNIRIPMELIFTPETRPIISPSRRMCVELPIAPADAITASGTIVFEEVGG